MIVALAATAGLEIELERHRLAHGAERRGGGLLGQDRAAEIGVQHGAGEVEDGPQARPRLVLEAAGGGGGDGGGIAGRGIASRRAHRRRVTAPRARLERRADRADHGGAAEPLRLAMPAASVRRTSSTRGELAQRRVGHRRRYCLAYLRSAKAVVSPP